jgi:hypothetical protein
MQYLLYFPSYMALKVCSTYPLAVTNVLPEVAISVEHYIFTYPSTRLHLPLASVIVKSSFSDC